MCCKRTWNLILRGFSILEFKLSRESSTHYSLLCTPPLLRNSKYYPPSLLKALTPPLLRYVLAQVYSAVTFCLQNGVDHRDVKDQNILINKNTHHVQLIDFGGASIVTRDTVYTTIQGTEVFLPPEAFNIHGYTPLEGSVWGLGCLLYCMVCGRPPFKSKREVVQLEVVYPTFLSASCMDFIKVCLMKERGRRMRYEEISSHCWARDLWYLTQLHFWTCILLYHTRALTFGVINSHISTYSKWPLKVLGVIQYGFTTYTRGYESYNTRAVRHSWDHNFITPLPLALVQ